MGIRKDRVKVFSGFELPIDEQKENKVNPINRLPSLAFWSAHIKNGHFPAIYIGMTEARSAVQAKQRILKEWKGQFKTIEQIKSGKFQLLVRRLGIKKYEVPTRY